MHLQIASYLHFLRKEEGGVQAKNLRSASHLHFKIEIITVQFSSVQSSAVSTL